MIHKSICILSAALLSTVCFARTVSFVNKTGETLTVNALRLYGLKSASKDQTVKSNNVRFGQPITVSTKSGGSCTFTMNTIMGNFNDSTNCDKLSASGSTSGPNITITVTKPS